MSIGHFSALLFTLTAVFSPVCLQAEKIVIKGSDTIGAKLAPQLAEEFKAQHEGVTFEIAAEGSSTGIAAIIDGTADIGMSSREVKGIEVSKARAGGVIFNPIVIGFDGIAVIVNAANPLDELSLDNVERVFTGEVTDWSAIGGNPSEISVYTRNTSSGTYVAFKEMAMSKRDYGSLSQKMAGNEQIASEVAKNPHGVGYVGLAYIDVPGVKVLKIDGVVPSAETIKSKEYAISRPLYFYTNGKKLTGLVAQFVDFTLSAEGQKIVAGVHFVPAK